MVWRPQFFQAIERQFEVTFCGFDTFVCLNLSGQPNALFNSGFVAVLFGFSYGKAFVVNGDYQQGLLSVSLAFVRRSRRCLGHSFFTIVRG
jgi:hypothetical protein